MDTLRVVAPKDRTETVRRMYEAGAEGDWSLLIAEASPDFVFHEDPGFPEAGNYEGAEAFRDYFEDLRTSFSEVRVELEDIQTVGERILALVHYTATGKDSGVPIEMRVNHLWTWRDSRLIEGRAFLDREVALDAAGLS